MWLNLEERVGRKSSRGWVKFQISIQCEILAPNKSKARIPLTSLGPGCHSLSPRLIQTLTHPHLIDRREGMGGSILNWFLFGMTSHVTC